MDRLILPDEILNRQICTECLNYLSVGPVMVSCEGKIMCGRCSSSKKSESKGWNHSLYYLVAEKLVFRCINYYEGCEELLNFDEAVEHERNCKKEGFKCPFCDYKGNGCQLVHHFGQKHPEYVMKEDHFKIIIKETFSRHLIFVNKNYIFCLTFAIRDFFMEFFNLLVSPAHLGPKHYKLRFFKPDTNIEFVTRPIQISHELGNTRSTTSLAQNVKYDTRAIKIRNSFLLDQTSLLECFPSGWCLCKIELIGESPYDTDRSLLKVNYLEKIIKKINTKLRIDIGETKDVKEIDEGNFDINCILKMSRSDLRKFINSELHLLQYCASCKKYITTVVYFCPKYHMACKPCSVNKCLKCGTCCQWSTKPKLSISLPCEWNGCIGTPDVFNYMVHKRDCPMRLYKCPDVDCEFEGPLVELKKHWHMNVVVYSNPLKVNCKSQSLFWYVNNFSEMFYVCIEFDKDTGHYRKLSVTINQVNVVISTCYDFRVSYYVYKNGNIEKQDNQICPVEGNNFVKFDQNSVYVGNPLELSCSLK